MREIRERGLLLRRIPYADSSLIVHVLTAGHGRLALMARGARRPKSPLRAALAPLYELRLIWRPGRSGMGTLCEVERGLVLLPSGHHLAGLQLLAVAAGLYPEGGTEGFNELKQALALLAAREPQSGLLTAVWVLLRQSGWVGDLDRCWSCGRHSEKLCWQAGELVCPACGGREELSLGLRRGIVGLMRTPRVYLRPADLDRWQAMTQDLLRRHGLAPLSLQAELL